MDGLPRELQLLRLPDVLKIIPVKKSAWWQGVRQGYFPKGHKIGPKLRVWTLGEIEDLLEKISSDQLK